MMPTAYTEIYNNRQSCEIQSSSTIIEHLLCAIGLRTRDMTANQTEMFWLLWSLVMNAGIYWYIQLRKESAVVGAMQDALGAKKRSLDLIWRLQKALLEKTVSQLKIWRMSKNWSRKRTIWYTIIKSFVLRMLPKILLFTSECCF